VKPDPRYLLIVLALAGDSTTTTLLPGTERWPFPPPYPGAAAAEISDFGDQIAGKALDPTGEFQLQQDGRDESD
jgi:hypothetical protein